MAVRVQGAYASAISSESLPSELPSVVSADANTRSRRWFLASRLVRVASRNRTALLRAATALLSVLDDARRLQGHCRRFGRGCARYSTRIEGMMPRDRDGGDEPTIPPNFQDKLTVGDLRKALEGHPDDMPVVIEIASPEANTDLAQAHVRAASVECRCDEEDRFYIYGDVEEDDAEFSDDLEAALQAAGYKHHPGMCLRNAVPCTSDEAHEKMLRLQGPTTVAWLIERRGINLCYSQDASSCRSWVTFSDPAAWRFEDKASAERIIAERSLPDVDAVEHKWSGAPR